MELECSILLQGHWAHEGEAGLLLLSLTANRNPWGGSKPEQTHSPLPEFRLGTEPRTEGILSGWVQYLEPILAHE